MEAVVHWTHGVLCIQVPQGRVIHMEVEIKSPACHSKPEELLASYNPGIRVYLVAEQYVPREGWQRLDLIKCGPAPPAAMLSDNSHVRIVRDAFSGGWMSLAVRFTAVLPGLKDALPVFATSALSGYMTSPLYDGVHRVPSDVAAFRELAVPPGHVLMVSFRRLDLQHLGDEECRSFLEFLVPGTNGTLSTLWRRCNETSVSAQILQTERFGVRLTTEYFGYLKMTGFKMLYSFHPEEKAPVKLDSGLFNCSVDHYSSFSQHLDCNLETECEGGEDETRHCPYSNAVCEGRVATGNSCLVLVSHQTVLPGSDKRNAYLRASKHCERMGGYLFTLKSQTLTADFEKLFHYGRRRWFRVYTGLVFADPAVPNLYRKMWVANHQTVIYNLHRFSMNGAEDGIKIYQMCLWYDVQAEWKFNWIFCSDETQQYDVVCEIPSIDHPVDGEPLIFSAELNTTDALTRAKQSLMQCPAGHTTHTFLTCDPLSHCGQSDFVSACNVHNDRVTTAGPGPQNAEESLTTSVSMFACGDGITTVHYTLLCDFRHDCPDESDESFCRHPTCPGFQCTSGQCLPPELRCDFLSDCLDHSDEVDCAQEAIHGQYHFGSVNSSSTIIDFDGHGSFFSVAREENESCPETHYRCPGEQDYCLPVYTRCNGLYDCLGREDEHGCQEARCPGFYRCRASAVCLHPDHLCDGWPQCPQRDDELLCDAECPEGCLCHGHAFLCSQPFLPSEYLELRYFEGKGFEANLSDFSPNHYLVHLGLVQCSISHLPEVTLPNLRSLDLRQNRLVFLDMAVFRGLGNLKILRLAENPLTNLTLSELHVDTGVLEFLDLSGTDLTYFNGDVLAGFPRLTFLNLSFASLHTIGENGFNATPQLSQVDLRGSPVQHFYYDLFRGLAELRDIYTPNYRLCCEVMSRSRQPRCVTEEDRLSSCQHLLRSEPYRIFFLLSGTVAVAMNAASVLQRCFVQREFLGSAPCVLLSNLNAANFVTGVYLVIIAAANEVFRGRYVLHEQAWKNGVTCRLAGYLSLLSGQVSVLLIFLITLDRVLAVRFPLSRVRFHRQSARAACLMAWLAGFMLALVPALPSLSHWRFYSQTGLCTPLPVPRYDFEGRQYQFFLHTVVNVAFSALSLAGEVLLYRVISESKASVNLGKRPYDVILSERLLHVAVTDLLACFTCGAFVLLGYTRHLVVSQEVSVAVAVFVAPVNSALNPVLYFVNLMLERKRKRREERLLTFLKSRAVAQKRGDL